MQLSPNECKSKTENSCNKACACLDVCQQYHIQWNNQDIIIGSVLSTIISNTQTRDFAQRKVLGVLTDRFQHEFEQLVSSLRGVCKSIDLIC